MKFWDASAIVPLVVTESATAALQTLAVKDGAMLVWWGSYVECASAIARLERDGALGDNDAARAFATLSALAGAWYEVEPSDAIREAAVRFLRVHPLRAADALQLSAAFIAADFQPPALTFVTRDDRLAAAARKEGFVVIT
jgi:uncharacterized protein